MRYRLGRIGPEDHSFWRDPCLNLATIARASTATSFTSWELPSILDCRCSRTRSSTLSSGGTWRCITKKRGPSFNTWRKSIGCQSSTLWMRMGWSCFHWRRGGSRERSMGLWWGTTKHIFTLGTSPLIIRSKTPMFTKLLTVSNN